MYSMALTEVHIAYRINALQMISQCHTMFENLNYAPSMLMALQGTVRLCDIGHI